MMYTLEKSYFYSFVALLLFLSMPLSAQEKELNLIISTLKNVNNEQVQLNMLKGIIEGLKGVNKLPAPTGWSEVNSSIAKRQNGELKKLAAQLNQKFGNQEAIKEALATVKNNKAPIAERRTALTSLVSQKNKALLPELEGLLSGKLRSDAIRAYGSFQGKNIPATLLKHYPSFDEASKRTVVETLATRKEFAQELLSALKKGSVKKEEIPAYVARNLQNILGKSFTEAYGDTQQVSEDKTKLIATYKSKLNSPAFAKADASNGRAVYQRTCAACHKLYDSGGIIGPDLTGSNRADQDYILLNIIDPSFDMPEAYRMVTVTKKDGQILTGNIIDEDQQKIVVSMVGAKTVVSKADIKSRVVSKVSMMPEGLLKTLSDKDFLDLIKYLQTEKQVEMPK
ncbi:MAG: c-type cytochrome [Lentisphaeraceae bacterium]|nr:c-type cytochrome [Lentisphaeraceae bacterium]